MSIKGYKVFNPDWTCRGFQYEVGNTYKHDGDIRMCGEGFHFCHNIADCFNYYAFNSDNKVAEIEAIGLVKTKGDKSVTNEIKIIRELTWHEVLDLVNIGKKCTGLRNSGNGNSGNWNSGYCNCGNCNSGDRNSGRHNSGDHNSGDSNSGNWNSGNWNSGSHNSGDFNRGGYNTGDWNSTIFSTGFFNSMEQPVYAFNKPLEISRYEFCDNIGIRAMTVNYRNNYYVHSKHMTDEEKKEHPEHETTGGYLKTVDFETACSMMWSKMTKEEREAVKQLPNFDADVFKEITGIDVNKE